MLKMVSWVTFILPCIMAVSFLFGYSVQTAGLQLPSSELLVLVRAGLIFCASLIPVLLVQLLGTALGVRLLCGPMTVAFILPMHANSLKEWLFYSWSFKSSRGLQEGVRILGVEMARIGDLRFMFMNVDYPNLPTYYRRFQFSAR